MVASITVAFMWLFVGTYALEAPACPGVVGLEACSALRQADVSQAQEDAFWLQRSNAEVGRLTESLPSPSPTPASLTTPPSATSSGGTMQNGKIDNAMVNLYNSGSPRFGPAGFAFYAKVKRSETKRYMRIFDFGDGSWKYNIFAALDVSSAVRHGQAKNYNLEFRHIYAEGNCDVSPDICTKMNVPNFLNVNEEAEVLFTIGPNGAMQAYKKLAGASEWTLAGYTHNANGELVYDFLQNDLNNKVHPVVDTDRKNLWVGQDNWSHGQGWEGSINDVRVWTEPVSPVAPPEQTSCNFEPGIKSGRDWQARMDEMIGDTSTKFCSEFTFKKNTAYWASPGHFIHELPIVGELKIPGSYGGKFSQTGAAKTKTVDDCKDACAQVSECAGFSYVGDDMLANSGPRTECWFYKKEAPCGGRKDSPTYWRSYTKNSVLNECAS